MGSCFLMVKDQGRRSKFQLESEEFSGIHKRQTKLESRGVGAGARNPQRLQGITVKGSESTCVGRVWKYCKLIHL